MRITKRGPRIWSVRLWWFFSFVSFFSFSVCSPFAIAQERLVLFGGGESPPKEAIELFSQWAGGTNAKVLLISWASGNSSLEESSPKGLDGANLQNALSSRKFTTEYLPYIEGKIEGAPPLSKMESPEVKKHFIEKQLAEATGVFFSGGDQNHIMDVLADPTLLQALTRAFRSGVPFSGTSAGTAIMSPLMLTGKEDLKSIDPLNNFLRPSLGFFREVILDQHFIVRQRQNRLLSALMSSRETLGIGIDEDAAISVIDSTEMQVIGENQVVVMEKTQNPKKFSIEILRGGDKYHLRKREIIERGSVSGQNS